VSGAVIRYYVWKWK